MWLVMAVLSAFFAGITSILAKCGIHKTDSDVATFIRTAVVLVFSWIMVFIVGSEGSISEISTKSFIFLILSGLATGASWICYFKALSMGDVNKIVPIDKSSSILTVISAIIIFGETNGIYVKLVGILLIGIGVFLMIEKKAVKSNPSSKKYIPLAIASAVFASLTSILAKIGIEGVESNLGTAIRTVVVFIMSFVIIQMKKKTDLLKKLDKKELVFIILSGFATGGSWLCYYSAIQSGIVSVVVPIDKLSIIFSIVFSWVVFKEKLTKKAFIGLALMVVGTLAMAIWA